MVQQRSEGTPVRQAADAGDSLEKGVLDGTRAILTAAGLALAKLKQVLHSLYGDAALQGAHEAAVASGGTVPPSFTLELPDGYWDRWTPGYGPAATLIENGGLAQMLQDADVWIDEMVDTQVSRIADAIAAGIRDGMPIDRTTAAVNAILHDEKRAWLVAETEYARAMTMAARATYKANNVAEVQWLAQADCCPRCAANLAVSPIPLGDSWPNGDVPVHPRCLPGDVRVIAPSLLRAATEREYVGDLVIIRLAGGHELSATPNHPVATPQGWVAISELTEGSDVLRSTGAQWIAGGVHPDKDHVPPSIKQVAETFSVSLGAMPTSAEDFHGDGAGSKVHVVRTDGLLLNDRAPLGAQHVRQHRLGNGDVAQLLLDAQRLLLKEGGGLGDSADDGVGGGREALAFFRRRLCHAGIHRGAASPRDDAVIQEDATDGAAADAEGFCQGLLAFSGEIASDKVVAVRRLPFSGHVYNLDTEDGWYISNGIVTHNCRCAEAPAVKVPNLPLLP